MYQIPMGPLPSAPAALKVVEALPQRSSEARFDKYQSWRACDLAWEFQLTAGYWRQGDYLACSLMLLVRLFREGKCFFEATMSAPDMSLDVLHRGLGADLVPPRLLQEYARARALADAWFQEVAATDPMQVPVIPDSDIPF